MMAGWWLISALVLALISGVFASLVLSLHTLSRVRMTAELQSIRHEPLIRRVQTIVNDVAAHTAALAIFRSAARFTSAMCMVFWAAGLRQEASPTAVSLVIGLLCAIAVLWVVSNLIPMGVAAHAGERAVVKFSMLIRAAHLIFVPLLPVWRFTDEVIRRLAGADSNGKEFTISADDLRSIVDDDEIEARLDETERDMLEAVVEFRSTSVEQIMTPRTEIKALEYTDDIEKVMAFVDGQGHSRIPVYGDNLDHIEGMLYAKDLLRWIIAHGKDNRPFVLRNLLREPTFVPETKTVRELLAQLLADQVHIAIILDEYGGNSGLVTMEDIVEEIFGEIQDEFEDPQDSNGGVVVDITTRAAEIDARTDIDDANDELETLGIELPESDDYDTVGGFINTTLGRIPERGETFDHESVRIEILEAEPTRVVRLRVSRAPEADESRDESQDSRPAVDAQT
ncbi:MAG: hemolysin family protein [Phycisphaerales bacterium]